jgi:hypothetical protein
MKEALLAFIMGKKTTVVIRLRLESYFPQTRVEQTKK